MTYYGAKELQAAFDTVRRNTLIIADELSAEQYAYRAAPGVKTVGEILAHLAVAPMWHIAVHTAHVSLFSFDDFREGMAKAEAAEQALRTKDQIVAALRANGETFSVFLGGLTEATLQERVSFPPPVQPESKTRFEMILGAKEHEMHHRAQLMLIQRMLGIVPHLTRQRQAAAAATAGAR